MHYNTEYKVSPEQSRVSGAAAAGARRRYAVYAATATAFERIAEVENPVRRYRERTKPVVFHTVLDLTGVLATPGHSTSLRFPEHWL